MVWNMLLHGTRRVLAALDSHDAPSNSQLADDSDALAEAYAADALDLLDRHPHTIAARLSAIRRLERDTGVTLLELADEQHGRARAAALMRAERLRIDAAYSDPEERERQRHILNDRLRHARVMLRWAERRSVIPGVDLSRYGPL